MRDEALYSLRLWRDGDDAADWRFSLEDMRTRERAHFHRLRDLVRFLRQRTAEPGTAPPDA